MSKLRFTNQEGQNVDLELVGMVENSLNVGSASDSQKLILGATSNVASAAINSTSAVVTLTENGFITKGSSPVAVGDGTDQYLLANVSYRITGITSGEQLAFYGDGTAGLVYITPGG